jgi:ribonuclease T2
MEMNWKQHLPDIFLGISLAMIGIEAALASASMIKARYRAGDTFASLAELSQPAQAMERPPAAIAAAFLGANPRLPAQSVVVTCSGQDVPRLREVHICLTRDLAPRACSADVLHGACRAPLVVIPPLR